MLRNVEIDVRAYGKSGDFVPPKLKRDKVQFNIRVEREVLDHFRRYCLANGLDPQGQVVLFMKRVLDSEFDFQQRLWQALQRENL